MDNQLVILWNKNAELPDRIVFSSGFLANFPDMKGYDLLEEVLDSSEMYGMGINYMYCKFVENSYQSGMIGLRIVRFLIVDRDMPFYFFHLKGTVYGKGGGIYAKAHKL